MFDIENSTFTGLYSLYKSVIQTILRGVIEGRNDYLYHLAKYSSNTFVSCFTADCIERGKDVGEGGGRYNHSYLVTSGFSTIVDSFNAIRQAVYEEKIISLKELIQVLKDNFKGNERFRQYLLNCCPKYGNDDPVADEIAVDLYNFPN